MDENYALVQGGVVINTIVWDGNPETWSAPQGVTAVLMPANETVEIGWTYSGSTFSAPA